MKVVVTVGPPVDTGERPSKDELRMLAIRLLREGRNAAREAEHESQMRFDLRDVFEKQV
jgi:hypothetical protein